LIAREDFIAFSPVKASNLIQYLNIIKVS
jgi:hypothetical protein